MSRDGTHRVASLAFDGNHQNPLSVRHDLLADFSRLGTEIGTPYYAHFHLSIDNQRKAYRVLLMPDEPRCPVDCVLLTDEAHDVPGS